MLPKKTVVKETPNVPVVKKVKPKKNEYLRECFQTIINRELLHMNVRKVNDILMNDVHIDLKNLPYRLQCVLAECLCHYMKVWPGWTKYEQHCKTDKSKRDYFEKFRQYLTFKMNYIITNEHSFWNDPPPDPSESENKICKEIQTDSIVKNQKPEAPYNLVISGQPNVLNNIVFIELDNNIVIKQHAEKPWKTLTIPEFLNYSFVYVEVTLPDIHLSRSNLHEFQRYITECGDTATCPEVDYITYIRKCTRNVGSKVYTFNFISAYFAQFLEVIKQVPMINFVRVTELEEIFKEFLKDIQATNLHGQTMATNTSVCYNIGGNKYIRNKKMVVNSQTKKDTNAINFCEILIPRTSYTLHEFTAEEDLMTEYTTFKSLNEILCLIKKGKQSDFYSMIETINNCISYQCILCPKSYHGEHAYVEMLDHFRFLHKGEQSVLCFKCRRQFEVSKLSGDRWAHVCEPKTTSASTSAGGVSSTTTVTASTTSVSVTNVTSKVTTTNTSMLRNMLNTDKASSKTSTSSFSNTHNSFTELTGNNSNVSNADLDAPISVNNLVVVSTIPDIAGSNTSVNSSNSATMVSSNNSDVKISNAFQDSNTLTTTTNSYPIMSDLFADISIEEVSSGTESCATNTTASVTTNYVASPNFTNAISNDVFENFTANNTTLTRVATTHNSPFQNFNVTTTTLDETSTINSTSYVTDSITLPPTNIDSEAATTINLNSIIDSIGF